MRLFGAQTTTISVSIPELTRAADSEKGALDNEVLKNHYLRFILEIHNGTYRVRHSVVSKSTTAEFPVAIVPGHEYQFAVWADFVKSESDTDLYYNTQDGLDKVTMLSGEGVAMAMTEARDAYYGSKTLGKEGNISEVSQFTLTRPFAKLRVVTNDVEKSIALGHTPKSATVTYGTDVAVYNTFNVITKSPSFDETAADVRTKSFTYAASDYPASDLYVDYILVPQTQPSTVQFTLAVNGETSAIKTLPFNTEIPVEANKLTSIVGNLLTTNGNIDVGIEDQITERNRLLETLRTGGEYTLTKDMAINISTRLRGNAVIDLGGYTLTFKGTDIMTRVESGSELVFKNGNIESTDYIASVNEGGKLLIESGTYTTEECTLFSCNGGQIEILGGEFRAAEYNGDHRYTLNHIDSMKETGLISVSGGRFYKFDPANNDAENPRMSFLNLKGDYCTIADGDWFEIFNGVAVSTSDKLVEAIAKGGKVVLTQDIILEEMIIVNSNTNVELDLHGHKITVNDTTIDPVVDSKINSHITITGNGEIYMTNPVVTLTVPFGVVVFENGRFIRPIEEGQQAGAFFAGASTHKDAGIIINGGYFDGGYYDDAADDVDDILEGKKSIDNETDAYIKKRKDAIKNNIQRTMNRSASYINVYNGTFVGFNPAWGDEGRFLPTNPNLRPNGSDQGSFLVGQIRYDDKLEIPEGYTITKSEHEDGRPIYTVTYNKQ
ncbi:MAG: hypothetical protein J6Q95_07860 [Alistipes sp.]|nr:hypothetical protein [Alistipes sp.]